METQFDSSSKTNILKFTRGGNKGQTKSRIDYVLNTICVGIFGLALGLVIGFALAYVLVHKEYQIQSQQDIDGGKYPGKLI